MPLKDDNKNKSDHKLKEILKLLKKNYALVVIDTLNSPYPGYEGYIQKVDHNLVYLSSTINERPYSIVPISNIIDIYAINVEVDEKKVGKIRDDINKIIQEGINNKEKGSILTAIKELDDSQEDSLLIKIYTKSIVYQVYDEIKLNQISNSNEEFLFIYYEETNQSRSKEVMIIFPQNSIDSIIIYNDITKPVIKHLPKEKTIMNLYNKSEEDLKIAKNSPE